MADTIRENTMEDTPKKTLKSSIFNRTKTVIAYVTKTLWDGSKEMLFRMGGLMIIGTAVNGFTALYPLGRKLLDSFGINQPQFPSAVEILDWAVRIAPYAVPPLGAAVAIALFWLRGHRPKFYGNLEIFVGLLTINSTASTVTRFDIPSTLPFLGGIYIVIRGLDNLAKGLSPESGTGKFFTRWFNNPPMRRS